jgi:CubicO group peptidase (beta-lactamase class C family)
MIARGALVALALFCQIAATAAQTPERVPHVKAEGQTSYHNYLTLKGHKAFAVSEGSGYGTGFGSATPEAAIQNALLSCKRRDPNGACKIYSLNGAVVWGQDAEAAGRAQILAQVKAGVSASTGTCREPVGRDFAGTGAAETGIALQRLVQLNEALDAAKHDIRALLIVRNCRLVLERYKDGISREHNHAVYSVTKSVSATLAGALLYQGKFKSVDLPVAGLMTKPWFMSAETWQKAERITFRNVMQMSTGLAYKHDPTGHPIYANNVDRFSVALTPPLIATPGTVFNYSDGDASITGAVIAAIADQHLYRFARETLFDPLQMANHDWPFQDQAGRPPGGWGLRLRTMDMAKLGQLYLQKGEWNGRRIFAADFIEAAWAPGSVSFYALHWWIGVSPNANGVPYFYANGLKGQRVFVFPTLGTVVAVSASLPGPEISAMDRQIITAIVEATKAAAGSGGGEALKQIQARGFAGETRIAQTDQDRPRR